MGFTGPLPENIRRRIAPEQRTTKHTQTMSDIEEKNRVKSEKELQRQIGQWLQMKGVKGGNPRMDKRTTLALGHPDFTFPWQPWGGRYVALEVKTDKGKQTEDQKQYEASIKENGGCYFLVRSLADVVNALSGESKEASNG